MIQILIYSTIIAKELALVKDAKEIGSAGTSTVHLNNEKSHIGGQNWTMGKTYLRCCQCGV
ncbi:hypothetical protein CROQUDRAFT_665789 [Cronartium quercuum f. sp. fusiforme G11]|uniref:Uncharacterized protein n=1 Tax=Cronartium quercuum f. sp. fusiforme G11 TaxID=708437 RepID=A0A9P6T616_9BASI|nr:hypothetical protein CROQUDRAFT_665789 [Cronartium quercuum f. sp. fusiforme G11]